MRRTVTGVDLGRDSIKAVEVEIDGAAAQIVRSVSIPRVRLEGQEPESVAAALAEGRAIYGQRCVYCHGDALDSDGMFADALRPRPLDFTDPGTIAQLTESFVFWRIAKGGPGLPPGSTPWDSSMPAWEKILSQGEMWDVIAFMYDHTGYRPRTKEDIEGGH